MAQGRRWERVELIQALSLYYQIPFGAIDGRTPAIQELARSLNRTVSSVALKLANFASLDPTILKSGRTGMRNASKLDAVIFDEFAGQWVELSTALPDKVTETLDPVDLEVDDRELVIRDGPTEAIREVSTRKRQSFFRNSVLAAYSRKCCVTGIAEPRLLRAGHIIPWSIAEDLRLDPRNGLCLNALYDAAFDRGLMTVDDNLRTVFSRELRPTVPTETYSDFFAPYEGRVIDSPDRLGPFEISLEYHRNNLFIG